jgi:hypothetical protein
MKVQIRYQNGCLTINIGGQSPANSSSGGNPGNDPVGGNPGNDPVGGNPGNDPVGGNPGNDPVGGGGGGGAGGCGGLILGPIVVPIGSSGSASGGNPGNDPVGGNPGNDPIGGNPGNDPVGGNGGSGGSGGGYSGPIVIGPIVFTNCGNGGASSSPNSGPSLLQPVNMNTLPAARQGVPSETPFLMQPQEEDQWCWNAVAVSVNNFLDFADPATWDQATLAAKVLPFQCSLAPNPNDPCDKAWPLDSALTATGNLLQTDLNQYVKFADLQAFWANNPLPVCVRVVWTDGSGNAHFVALTECILFSSGQQLVMVNDPSPAALGPAKWDYDVFRLSYQSPPNLQAPGTVQPKGFWNDTYFVQP